MGWSRYLWVWVSRAWKDTRTFSHAQLLVNALLFIAAFFITVALARVLSGELDFGTLVYGLGAGLGAVALIFFGALLINLIRAPWLMYNEAGAEVSTLRSRVDELEEAARPKLEAECQTILGLRIGHGRDRDAMAYLEVVNRGGGQVVNSYGQVEVIEHAPASGSVGAYRRQLYRSLDVFLAWQATGDRLHSFHESAKLRVAIGRSGDGRYDLTSLGSLFPALQLGWTYEVAVSVAADGMTPLQLRLFLAMNESAMEGEDGRRIWIPGAPYSVEFRLWVQGDAPEDEFDLDAWEAAHRVQ